MTIRVGVLGAGAIAKVHMEILKSHKNVSLNAVYDLDQTKAAEFASLFAMNVCEDPEALWPQIDALYITAPNRFHAEYALAALARSKHVFCEKPFALNLSDAQKLHAAAQTSGSVYQLGFNRRCAPAYRKIKQLLEDGTIKPSSFNIKMNRGELKNPAWTCDSQVTGGFLFESTLHLLDTVRYLFGEVKEVKAIGSKAVYPCVDNFSLLLQMENGVHGVFSSCAHTTWSFPFERVEVYGAHSAVFNEEMEAVTYCQDLEHPVLSERFSTLSLAERWGYTLENKIFLDRIAGSLDVPSYLYADSADGLANVTFIEAIYEQIGLGK